MRYRINWYHNMQSWRQNLNQITLRQIPENIFNQLRILAQKGHTSINKTILFLLKKSLGLDDNAGKKRNLSDLAATWDENQLKEFNANTQIFEYIDHEVWKSWGSVLIQMLIPFLKQVIEQ